MKQNPNCVSTLVVKLFPKLLLMYADVTAQAPDQAIPSQKENLRVVTLMVMPRLLTSHQLHL